MKFLKRSQLDSKNVKDNHVAVEANGTVIVKTDNVQLGLPDTSIVTVNNDLAVIGNATIDGDLTLTGYLNLGGGASNAITVVSNLNPNADDTYNLGIPDKAWREIFTNKIKSSRNSNVLIEPIGTGKVDITSSLNIQQDLTVERNVSVDGNFIVTGTPYGTAPVVQNILHVTMDGLDTNDGSSQDASRACRTIGGAVRSPLYKPGTSIKVAPGHYFENNPILLKPYTSIIGSDLRTCSIEPINKTQDLFHVNSSTYIAQMQFINGRSGIIDPNIDRGAYAIAFPNTAAVFIGKTTVGSKVITGIATTEDIPIGSEIIASEFPLGTIVSSIDSQTQITVTISATTTNTAAVIETGKLTAYKSPYIQNCTNQSGPWLKDGTMFVPNQTVQLPLAVGISTFDNNKTTITVNITQGEVPKVGMSINTAPQDRGFFDARTLLLANKSFVQEQILAYIAQMHPTFTYQQEKCRRDVGIILENVLYDTCFGGNSKSVESGLAYYVGARSVIIGEEAITAEALDYILVLVNYIVSNLAAPNLVPNTGIHPQVFNLVLANGSFAIESITNNMNIIKNIIVNGPTAAPTVFYSTGAEQGQVSAEVLIQANRKFLQKEVSAFIEQSYPGLISFDETLCRRDIGLIIDAVLDDMIFGTNYRSLVAGRSYLRSYTTKVLKSQKEKTLGGINKARDLAIGYAVTQDAKDKIISGFKLITDIIKNEKDFTDSDLYFTNPLNTEISVGNSGYNLQRNKAFIKAEINAWIANQISNATAGSMWKGFTFNTDKCTRDVGYIIDCLTYDLLYNGNQQSLDSANTYRRGSTVYISGEVEQTIAAFTRIKDIVGNIIRNVVIIPSTGNNTVPQFTLASPGSYAEATKLQNLIDQIIIVLRGSSVVTTLPTYANGVSYATLNNDKALVLDNVPTIQNDTIAYLLANFNPTELCERDVGLIVDCLSQDVLLNGNDRSITAGKTYYDARGLVIAAESTETIAALTHITSVVVSITKNILVVPTVGNSQTQVTNTFFNKGGITQSIIERNIGIISSIIANGPSAAPPVYIGTSLFSSTGVSADDVKQSTKVVSVTARPDLGPTIHDIALSQPTVGIGSNSTLYFGNTTVYPLKEEELDAYPQWEQRRYDPYGSMGGMIIDGAAVSEISPIRSMVIDAFTQVNQGGRGIRATRKGYAQLVSVFTIFSSIAIEADSGGILSITNSNSNFGDYCMISKGYGPLEFSGTVYNPPVQLYKNGYYPQSGVVEIFVPDADNRPHISLIMEVEPTKSYLNSQNVPGFLTATVTTSVIVANSLTITGIEVANMYIGQTIYVRDQFGSYNDPITGEPYLKPGTVITDIGPSTVYLNLPVNKGADYSSTNPTFFIIFTCGNAYYTVLTSSKASLPVPEGELVFPANQKPAEIAAVSYIKTLLPSIISNTTIASPLQATVPQVKNLVYALGSESTLRTNELISTVINIITNGVSSAPTIVKHSTVTKSNSDAALLIKANLDFIVAEVKKFMEINYPLQEYYVNKCLRDARLISFKVSEDLLVGGNYNSIYSGLSYYSRAGTYHLVTLEDNIRDASLFPDGVTVNFYQRSYMSASGYLFEYVGAGSNYGALPQVGRADPIQSQEVNMLDGGKVFFTSTDQNGDFRIGTGLVINQATGVLSGRTFQKSLLTGMAPLILSLD